MTEEQLFFVLFSFVVLVTTGTFLLQSRVRDVERKRRMVLWVQGAAAVVILPLLAHIFGLWILLILIPVVLVSLWALNRWMIFCSECGWPRIALHFMGLDSCPRCGAK